MRTMMTLGLCAVLALGLVACGDKAGGGDTLAGTWTLDVDATSPAVEAYLKEAGAPAEMISKSKEQLKAMNFTLKLTDDGNWTGEMNEPGKEGKSLSSGTWKQDGDKITVVTLKEDGKDVKERSFVATLKDGKIIARPDGTPFDMVIARK